MTEPFEVYTDAFTVSITPWGANISFALREAHPTPAAIREPTHLGTVRMSNEHLKTMVFMLRRQVMQQEQDTGTPCEVPAQVLNQLGIPPEDWDALWGRRG